MALINLPKFILYSIAGGAAAEAAVIYLMKSEYLQRSIIVFFVLKGLLQIKVYRNKSDICYFPESINDA